jgi:hypothetical protein
MRLSLIDIVIFGVLFLIGAGAAWVIACLTNPQWFGLFGLLCGAVSILLCASPIYRRFCFRPLFLPTCPHCQKRPDSYTIVDGGWPREVLACSDCNGSCELWYDTKLQLPSASLPSLRLCWPYFLGRYKPASE